METICIKAKAGKEKDAQEFNSEVEMPEDINEAIKTFGEEEVYSLWRQQKIVRLQAALRTPSARKTTSTYGVYRKCIDRGMDDSTARDISGYTGNSDGSVDEPVNGSDSDS